MQKNFSRLKAVINKKLSFYPIIFGIPISKFSADPLGGKFRAIANYIGFALNLIIGAGASLAVVYIILAGIAWTNVQGDPKALQGARAKLTWAVVGFIIVIGGLAGKVLIENLLGSSGTTILPSF